MVSLGFIYVSFGDYEKGQDLISQGSKLYEKYESKNNARIAWALVHLGYICRILGNYEQAIKHFERSLAIYKDYYSFEHHVARIQSELKILQVIIELSIGNSLYNFSKPV